MQTTANRIDLITALQKKRQAFELEQTRDNGAKVFGAYKRELVAKLAKCLKTVKESKGFEGIDDAFDGSTYLRRPTMPEQVSHRLAIYDRAIGQLTVSKDATIRLDDKRDEWILKLIA